MQVGFLSGMRAKARPLPDRERTAPASFSGLEVVGQRALPRLLAQGAVSSTVKRNTAGG